MDERTGSILKNIGLQFFAEGNSGGEGGANPGGEPGGNSGGDQSQNQQQNQQGSEEKKFTQEEVTRLTANEKRQGRQSVLKELGLDPNDREALKKAKEILDSHKSQAERDAEAVKIANQTAEAAELRAAQAERKLSVIAEGCKAEFVDEVLAMASAKVDDKTDFAAAVKAVKEKCSVFFDGGSDEGTGRGQGRQQHGGHSNKPGSFGARLAQNTAQIPKNPYFSD